MFYRIDACLLYIHSFSKNIFELEKVAVNDALPFKASQRDGIACGHRATTYSSTGQIAFLPPH